MLSRQFTKYVIVSEINATVAGQFGQFKLPFKQAEIFKNFILSTYDYKFKTWNPDKLFQDCFWYIPDSIRTYPKFDMRDKELLDELLKILGTEEID